MLASCGPKTDPRAREPVPEPEENSPMLEAIALEIREVVSKPLTSDKLQEVILLCQSAQQVLFIREPRNRLKQKKGVRMMGGPIMAGYNPGYVGSYYDEGEPMSNGQLDRETFGAKILRELVNVIPHIARVNREDPAKLIEAIAAAEKHGMTELAADLKERLTNPKPPEIDITPPGVPNSTAPQPQAQEG
jgi:hypothetical protein